MNSRYKIVSLTLLLLSVLAFQNCSGIKGFVSFEALEDLKLYGGNGGGYDGKPDGTYYRFIPNYTCSNQSTALAVAEIRDGQAFLYDNKADQCAQTSTPIAPSDLNLSPFQNEFISVKDALFKRYDVKPSGIPPDLAEVLCRDDYDKPTFEIVSHFNRETHQAKTRVYFPDHIEPDFEAGRILSSSEVRYVSNELTYKVDFSKALPTRKFQGIIESSKIAGVTPKQLTCVIGGSLDTSNWHFRELSQISASVIDFLGQEPVFVHEVSQAFHQLFKIASDNSTIDFTAKYFGPTASFQTVTSSQDGNNNLKFLKIRWPNDNFDSDYLFQLNEDRMTRLTNLQSGPAQNKFVINLGYTENQHMIYAEFDQPNYTSALQDLDLVTQKKVNFLNGPYSMVTQKRMNKAIVYDMSDSRARSLKIYNTVTGTTEILSVKLPDSCWITAPPYFSIDDDQGVMAYYGCSYDRPVRVVEISTVDGSVYEIGKDLSFQWTSQDHRWIAFTYLSTRILYDTVTRKSIPMPLEPGLITYRGGVGVEYTNRAGNEPVIIDQRWMYAFGYQDTPTLYKLDLATGESTKICESLPGKKLWVGTLPDKTLYLFAYDESLTLYRFYQIENGQNCVLLNQFPTTNYAVSFQPTSIGFTMQLARNETAGIEEIVFVPVDGRPPMKLNWSLGGTWAAKPAPDNRRVLLLGPAANGETRVFSFDLF